MQALGAYGVIGVLGEKKEFLRHIQPAIKTLIEVASMAENFSFFAEFLTSLPDRPKPSDLTRVTTNKIDLERLQTVVIENVDPCINGGRYPIKRVIGQELKVSADIFKDGHDQISANLKWRKASTADSNRTPHATGRERPMGRHLSFHRKRSFTSSRSKHGKIVLNHGRSNLARSMARVTRT